MGAAIGFEKVSQPVGVTFAIVVGLLVGLRVLQIKKKYLKADTEAQRTR